MKNSTNDAATPSILNGMHIEQVLPLVASATVALSRNRRIVFVGTAAANWAALAAYSLAQAVDGRPFPQ